MFLFWDRTTDHVHAEAVPKGAQSKLCVFEYVLHIMMAMPVFQFLEPNYDWRMVEAAMIAVHA